MLWATVKRLFPDRPQAQRKELLRAYEGLFSCPEGQVVLTDLANYTGFYFASPDDLSAEKRAYRDGMKAVYARIFHMVRLTDAEREALEVAFREENLPKTP